MRSALFFVLFLIFCLLSGCVTAQGSYDPDTGKIQFTLVRMLYTHQLDSLVVSTPSGYAVEMSGLKSDPQTAMLEAVFKMLAAKDAAAAAERQQLMEELKARPLVEPSASSSHPPWEPPKEIPQYTGSVP